MIGLTKSSWSAVKIRPAAVRTSGQHGSGYVGRCGSAFREYHQMWLVGGAGAPRFADGARDISFAELYPAAAMISTGVAMGPVRVKVAVLDAPPAEVDSSEPWEQVAEFSMTKDAAHPIRLASLEAVAEPSVPHVSEPGSNRPVRVRVHGVGREPRCGRHRVRPDRDLPHPVVERGVSRSSGHPGHCEQHRVRRLGRAACHPSRR
jgi:hypothetical protein